MAANEINLIIETLKNSSSAINAEAIKEIKREAGIGKQKVLLIIPTPEISFHVHADGYQLEYFQWPLGPFHGYDSRKAEWYNIE